MGHLFRPLTEYRVPDKEGGVHTEPRLDLNEDSGVADHILAG